MKALNLIRVVAHTSLGADQHTLLLHLYKSFVRSKTLTYACLTLYRIMLSVYVSAHIELPHLQVSVS